jgi:predicted esterase
VVRLEVKSGDSDQWRDAGPINLIDGVTDLNIHGNTYLQHKQTAPKQNHEQLTKELPSNVKSFLRNQEYKYRHSPDSVDTNLLILFHGAGDTHEQYDKLAKQMELPQTATLALSSNNVELPFGLGYTWFEEMDDLGNVLDNDDARRLSSLGKAVDWLEELLICLLFEVDSNKESTDIINSFTWIPERVFLLGFSAGACLAMELCRSWRANKRSALGGTICIAGGLKTKTLPLPNKPINKQNHKPDDTKHYEATDVLVIAGSNDNVFSTKSALKSKQFYEPPTKVKVYTQEGKDHSMIGSKSEMSVVMEFLSKRLVRRMASSMEGMTCT